MDPKLFIASKGFIVRDGKVLVIREAASYKDGTQLNKYDLPGGRMTPGEVLQEALQREVLEETGLRVTVEKPVSVSESRPTVKGEAWQIVRVFFLCTAEAGEVALSEDHDDYKWIDPRAYKNSEIIENMFQDFEAYLKM